MTIRVLHVEQPVDGGVVGVVASLLADQVDRGWDVHLACPPESQLHAEAARMGVTLHSWTATRAPDAATATQTRALKKIIRRVAPDVVHLHSAKAGLAGRLAIRGAIPTIFMPHMWSFQAEGKLVTKAARHWEVFASRWTSRFLCVSDDEAATGRAAGIGGEMTVVENGVDLKRFAVRDRADARRALSLPDAPTVVCVGRLAPQKGQDLLMEAWERVLEAVPDAHLVIVGDGPFGDFVRQNYPVSRHESVHWVGATNDPRPYLAASDVLVVSSRSEGMALVPLEALAMARPVVSFAVGGIERSVGEAGAVVPQGDVAALAREVVRRLGDPILVSTEGATGRCRAEQLFNLEDAVGKVAETTMALSRRKHSR